MARIRAHLRSHAFGYLALFVALSGTAYATNTGRANTIASIDIINGEVRTADLADDAVTSPKVLNNSLGTQDVVDESLKGIDIRDGQVRSPEIGDGSIGGVDVANDSLGGAAVDESSLDLATEGWHEIGAAGEPGFNAFVTCSWANSDPTNFASAAFSRDRHGVVRLKGRVNAVDGLGCDFSSADDRLIFTLPPGYRPEKRDAHAVLTNFALGRVNVDPDGAVSVDPPTTEANARQWVSLDGIDFRCLPSGNDGCP